MFIRALSILLALSVLPGSAFAVGSNGEDHVAGGLHKRLLSRKGAIHLWWPKDYEKEDAGVVVYLHGYGTTVDREWTSNKLATQFKRSGKNALFVVPESPASDKEDFTWFSLEALFKLLKTRSVQIPGGKIVIAGHSGAFKTMALWLKDKRISTLIMLDAMYGLQSKFQSFLTNSQTTRMLLVSYSTLFTAQSFAENFKYAQSRRFIPKYARLFTKAERRARLLNIRSQYDHFTIISSRRVIPVMLKLTRLAAVSHHS